MTSVTAAKAAVTLDSGQARPQAPGSDGSGDPSTSITFTVTSGALTMSVPAAAYLGSGAPGALISAPIGACFVDDERALASASWTVIAQETDFSNSPFTIPAGDATYTVGTVTTTGTITATPSDITLSNSAQTVLTGSSGVGDNTASWNPTLTVNVPATAVGGQYSGTLTQSVS
ncbi:MAG TPA: hypothetical protein VMU95_20485 [Trebonia sp.]|nr:hypothetical protein [Trebonia sp.]